MRRSRRAYLNDGLKRGDDARASRHERGSGFAAAAPDHVVRGVQLHGRHPRGAELAGVTASVARCGRVHATLCAHALLAASRASGHERRWPRAPRWTRLLFTAPRRWPGAPAPAERHSERVASVRAGWPHAAVRGAAPGGRPRLRGRPPVLGAPRVPRRRSPPAPGRGRSAPVRSRRAPVPAARPPARAAGEPPRRTGSLGPTTAPTRPEQRHVESTWRRRRVQHGRRALRFASGPLVARRASRVALLVAAHACTRRRVLRPAT